MPYTVDIPGGTAELLETGELTPRKQMPLSVHMLSASKLVAKMQKNQEVAELIAKQQAGEDIVQDGNPLEVPDIGLDATEAEQFLLMQYITAFVHLKSWTIDLPFPASVDDFLDSTPMDVVQALLLGVMKAKAKAQEEEAKFEESDAAIEDPDSPTMPSGPSGGQSFSAILPSSSTDGEADGSPNTSSSKPSPDTPTSPTSTPL